MPEFVDLPDLLKRIPVALYRSAPDGTLLAANPALAELLGYESVDEVIAKIGSVESVYVDPALRQHWIDQINEVSVIHDFDVELRRPDGSTVWVRDSARAIRDADGRIALYEGSLIDMTDKVQAQRDRDQFIATVSHELRNPVAVIVGLGEELGRNYDSFDDAERRDMAELIARQADDARWLIEDLLVAYREDVSKVAMSARDFDVVKQVERVLEVVEPEVDVVVESGETEVYADPRRTRQILRNLVSNAVRYGGDAIQVAISTSGDFLVISVKDSGPALTDAEVDRIFQPFETGSRANHPKSVGLGLSVASKLATLMGGELTYDHDGEWAAFSLTLPAA
jgi:PAS domain S-box-containing protein